MKIAKILIASILFLGMGSWIYQTIQTNNRLAFQKKYREERVATLEKLRLGAEEKQKTLVNARLEEINHEDYPTLIQTISDNKWCGVKLDLEPTSTFAEYLDSLKPVYDKSASIDKKIDVLKTLECMEATNAYDSKITQLQDEYAADKKVNTQADSLKSVTNDIAKMVYYNNKCASVYNLNGKIDYFISDNGYLPKARMIMNEVQRLINNWSNSSAVDNCNFIESQSSLYKYINQRN